MQPPHTPAPSATEGTGPIIPGIDHGVPWFWPMAAAMEMQEAGMELFERNLDAISAGIEIDSPPPPQWASANEIVLDLPTMRLRDFSRAPSSSAVPVLIDAPYAGHSSVIADYQPGQSLVETLLNCGLKRVLVTDWKSATPEMSDFDIDRYLAELNVAVDDLGGRVTLVGLCQGGWLSAMYAARFPHKVVSLVLAGSPIDTDAGDGPIKRLAHSLPLRFYERMVRMGNGCMLGKFMLAGWKNMHPDKQYLGKYLDLYAHVEDVDYVERTVAFESWYENPLDLPGRFYIQAIDLLFKRNLFAKGQFEALGRVLSLKTIACPLYLLAGEGDDITTYEQVFAAEALVSTPASDIVKTMVPGGHIGLFMGRRTLTQTWPGIAAWIAANAQDRA